MTVARLGYEIDSSGAVKAAGDLDKMSAAASKAESVKNVLASSSKKASADLFTLSGAASGAAASIIKSQQAASVGSASFSGLGADVAATARELALYGAELDMVRSRFDPLFAASKRYEQELRDIAEAEKMGAINANVASQARERAAAALSGTIPIAGKFSGAMQGSAAQTANLGAQLNDIGVMLAAGQNPLQLAVQQGTQINQVFAQMGGGKAALRGLAAGFMSMVNPMSLATIGIIAGGAALVQWAVAAAGAGEEADALAEAMDAIEESTRNAKLELQAMQMGLENVEQVLVQQQINALMSQREVLIDRLGNLEGQSDIHSVRKAANIKQQITLLGNEISSLNKIIDEENKALEAIEQQNYLLESTNLFLEAQQRLRNEAGAEMARQLKLEEDITKELGYGAVEALKLAGVDLSNLDDAARRAASLAASMGIAYSEAYALANVTFAPIGGGLTPDMPNLLPPTSTGTSGRGGGSRVDEFARDLESLRNSLRTEREVVDEWYMQQQEILANRRAMEILGIEGHNQAKLRLEQEYLERLNGINTGYHGTALDQAQTFFGDMASALQGGNDKMIAAAQAFASVEALINAYRAYNQVIADPTLPWFAKIPAAVGVLSAGLKTVSAIKSLSGSSSGTSASAGVTATSSAPQVQQTRAIVSVQSGRSRFTLDEINDIVAQLQDQSSDGVIIEGFTRG